MELARHSDMRLIMKTYADVAQPPLAATVAKMPAFGAVGDKPKPDTQIDTQTLVNGGQAASPAVLGIAETKKGKTIENIGESHGESLAVTAGQEESKWRREGDSNPRYELCLRILRFPRVYDTFEHA
jgi:hypothetical protein